jgi:hypothetical protein
MTDKPGRTETILGHLAALAHLVFRLLRRLLRLCVGQILAATYRLDLVGDVWGNGVYLDSGRNENRP